MKLKIKLLFATACLALVAFFSFPVTDFQKESSLLRKIRKIPLEDRTILEEFFLIEFLRKVALTSYLVISLWHSLCI